MSEIVLINPENHDRIVLVKHLRAGQPRPYADAVYESEITFTGKNLSTRPEHSTHVLGCHPYESVVKGMAYHLVHEFTENGHCMQSYLKSLECVEKKPGMSRWRVVIICPFTD